MHAINHVHSIFTNREVTGQLILGWISHNRLNKYKDGKNKDLHIQRGLWGEGIKTNRIDRTVSFNWKLTN